MNSAEFESNGSSSNFVFDTQLKKLTVRGVIEFPREVFDYGEDIEILDMSDNQMTSLPEDIQKLKNLRVAFFSGNTFTEFPRSLASCESLEMLGLKSCGIKKLGEYTLPPNLKGLILTDNLLTELPDTLGVYTHLKKLMLTGNQLCALPASLVELRELELIRLADNQLVSAPDWIAELPNLSWYADSGNAFNPHVAEVAQVNEFAWVDISIASKLGESSKNIVYSATLQTGDDVAVKMFGAGVTTDGSADNETTAALLAGNHPHVVGALGSIVGGPHNVRGLVMPLVPQEYKSLGFPPNFVDLTRDSYKEDARFNSGTVVNIARNIADALEHLHMKGVMHGDVYAHNVLFSNDGDAKLCDFGAASMYDPSLPTEAWREKLDVAGYGHLIEELLQRVVMEKSQDALMSTLRELATACLGDVSHRPTFNAITKVLHRVH
jgi:hypothetical protein